MDFSLQKVENNPYSGNLGHNGSQVEGMFIKTHRPSQGDLSAFTIRLCSDKFCRSEERCMNQTYARNRCEESGEYPISCPRHRSGSNGSSILPRQRPEATRVIGRSRACPDRQTHPRDSIVQEHAIPSNASLSEEPEGLSCVWIQRAVAGVRDPIAAFSTFR